MVDSNSSSLSEDDSLSQLHQFPHPHHQQQQQQQQQQHQHHLHPPHPSPLNPQHSFIDSGNPLEASQAQTFAAQTQAHFSAISASSHPLVLSQVQPSTTSSEQHPTSTPGLPAHDPVVPQDTKKLEALAPLASQISTLLPSNQAPSSYDLAFDQPASLQHEPPSTGPPSLRSESTFRIESPRTSFPQPLSHPPAAPEQSHQALAPAEPHPQVRLVQHPLQYQQQHQQQQQQQQQYHLSQQHKHPQLRYTDQNLLQQPLSAASIQRPSHIQRQSQLRHHFAHPTHQELQFTSQHPYLSQPLQHQPSPHPRGVHPHAYRPYYTPQPAHHPVWNSFPRSHLNVMDNPAHLAQAQAQAQAHAQAQAQAQQAAQNLRRKNAQDVLVGQGFRGLKRGRPTDRSLPPSLKRQVPESAFYADLQRMERNLDWTVARKRAELTDGLSRPPKIKRTLRIFLSNTCANQPFQLAEKQKSKEAAAGTDSNETKTEEGGEDKKADASAAAGSSTTDDDIVPSWTLRIEGRLLEPSFKSRANTALSAQASINRTGAHKFSNLIKTCVVELVRDPALYPEGDNLVEWHRPTPNVAPASGMQAGGGAGGLGGTQGMEAPLVASAEPALDGFEIKRKGNVPTKVKIVLYPSYTPERYSLSPELASLLDIREETRAGVISALWSYVKEKKLLDETDRRRVKCDGPLRALFNTAMINFHHIPEVVNRHLHPAQPIVIEYWIRTDKAEYKHSTAYDIELELEDLAVRQKQHNVLAQFDASSSSSSTEEGGVSRTKQIAELDDQIAQAAATIRNRSSARDFLASFAKDPQGHLRTWIASQARDLDAILGNNPTPGAQGSVSTFTQEELRRSETFRGNWIDEAVIVNEAQRLAEKLQELQNQALNNPNPSAGAPATSSNTAAAQQQ